jgi:hypothetical protein
MVETHQGKMSGSLMAIIERAQHEGLLPPMPLAQAKFIISGAFSLPIVLAAEVKIVTGENSLSPEFIERHIDSCLRLLIPAAHANLPAATAKKKSSKKSSKKSESCL